MWHVYILQCGDRSLYAGCTNDLAKRLKAHGCGKGAKYTRSRLPVTLVYRKKVSTKSRALKLEIEIKSLTRTEKLALIGRGRVGTNGRKAARLLPASADILIKPER